MVTKLFETSFGLPVFVYKVDNHDELKPQILMALESSGKHSILEANQRITNTDWLLPADYVKGYRDIVAGVVDTHLTALSNDLYLTQRQWVLAGLWFQQYEEGDFHNLHVHGNCSYANVYYVELGELASKTTFTIRGEEFEVDVEEGSILSFPGFIEHKSKPNSGGRKTVIAYNSSFA